MKKNMTNEEHFGDGSTGFSCGGGVWHRKISTIGIKTIKNNH